MKTGQLGDVMRESADIAHTCGLDLPSPKLSQCNQSSNQSQGSLLIAQANLSLVRFVYCSSPIPRMSLHYHCASSSTFPFRSFARVMYAKLRPGDSFFEEAKLHLHVPAGATPKDGPSAGCTLITAMLSKALGALAATKHLVPNSSWSHTP